MLNICLFGAGRMGRDHAQRIFQHPDARLHTVVDPNQTAAQEVSELYGAQALSGAPEALAQPEIDAVLIASSADTHTDLICAAAAAGKPIFCEKPIDLTLEQTDRAIDAVETARVPLLVAFNRRFDPSFAALKDRVDQGEIGAIELVSITNRDAVMPELKFLKTSGGIFLDFTIHDFDTARWILGEEPVEVFATGSCLINPDMQEFGDSDTAVVILKTETGRIAQINNSRRCVYGYDQRLEVWGAQGMLRVNNQNITSVEAASAKGFGQDPLLESFPQRFEDAYREEVDHFIRDVVMKGQAPRVSGFDARQNLVLALAATESAKLGKPMRINSHVGAAT